MKKFMAFRMSGLQGLCVVEEVIKISSGDEWLAEMRWNPGWFHIRFDSDGEVYETREQAQDACDRMNENNPFVSH